MSRRSRFVGRPAPRSRCAKTARSSFGGGAGVRSSNAAAARAALTRFTSSWRTTRIRAPCRVTTRTSIPGRISCEGFAVSPPTFTCPALQRAVAAERDFVTRTAHSHTSTRTDSATIAAPLARANRLALLLHPLDEQPPGPAHGRLGQHRRAGRLGSVHLDAPDETIRTRAGRLRIPRARFDEPAPHGALLRLDAPAAPHTGDPARADHPDPHLRLAHHRSSLPRRASRRAPRRARPTPHRNARRRHASSRGRNRGSRRRPAGPG